MRNPCYSCYLRFLLSFPAPNCDFDRVVNVLHNEKNLSYREGASSIMSLPTFNRHTIISNKLLIAMSGLSSWTLRDGQYMYEKHNYHISTPYLTQKWSKSAIKQFLVYTSLCNSDGEMRFVSEKDIAELTGLSTRTIQENNKQFQENGIIAFRRIWSEFLEITIHNYTEEVRDLTINEDGSTTSRTGYTSIWYEVVTQLLAIRNINQLRLALRSLLAFEKEVNVQQSDEAILSYDEIKGFLPSYIGYKKAIKEMVETLSNFLHITCMESAELVKELYHRQTKKRPSLIDKLSKPFALTVYITTDLDSKKIKNQERHDARLSWFDFIRRVRQFVPVEKVHMNTSDLHSLSDTYGSTLFKDALHKIQAFLSRDELSGLQKEQITQQLTYAPTEYISSFLTNLHQAKTIQS